MQALSQSTSYAVQALTCLVLHANDTLLVREIAEETGIGQAYLAKVVQRLSAAGVVESKRGYRGGIRLSRPAEKISIQDIDNAVDANRPPDRCLLGLMECSDERACPAHHYWTKTRAQIRERLASLTLADLAAFEKGRLARLVQEGV